MSSVYAEQMFAPLPLSCPSLYCLCLVRHSPHHQHQEREPCLKTETVNFTAGNPVPPLFSVRGKQTKGRDRTLRSSAIGMRRRPTRKCPSTTPSQTSGGHLSSWGLPVSAGTSYGRGCWTTPASSPLLFRVSSLSSVQSAVD